MHTSWNCSNMDKLKLTGQNLGQVFHSRLGHAGIGHAIVHITKQPNLKLKTQPKQLLSYLPGFCPVCYNLYCYSCKLQW
jgi:hypothetical protein